MGRMDMVLPPVLTWMEKLPEAIGILPGRAEDKLLPATAETLDGLRTELTWA